MAAQKKSEGLLMVLLIYFISGLLSTWCFISGKKRDDYMST